MNKSRIIVIVLALVIAIGISGCTDNNDNNKLNSLNNLNLNNSIKLSYDIYIGDKIKAYKGYSVTDISKSIYNNNDNNDNNNESYELNITTITSHDADTDTPIKSGHLIYATDEFKPLYVLYKDNSTSPTIPERILEVNFKNNSALIYSKYLKRTGKGLSKSYSVTEKNETISLNEQTYTQMIIRFLKISNIPLAKGYKEQFILVNQNMTIEVLGTENVKTPAGSFECWKVKEILHKLDTTENSIIWYSTNRHIPIKIKNDDTGLYQVLTKFD